MDELFIKNLSFDEGKLSKICSSINNNQTFTVLAVKLGLNRGLYYDYAINDKYTEIHDFAKIQTENLYYLLHV